MKRRFFDGLFEDLSHLTLRLLIYTKPLATSSCCDSLGLGHAGIFFSLGKIHSYVFVDNPCRVW